MPRPLVAVRRAAPFDPSFLERHSVLWPLAGAANGLRPLADFPPIDQLLRVFASPPPVRFVPATPHRRRGAPVDVASLYDARITLCGEVPTRAACWHDFMNALVWGTFPVAKRALHARQHRAIAARVPPGARTLPPRSPELDALALLDEGGLVILAEEPEHARAHLSANTPGRLRSLVDSRRARALVFGHAIYESLVLGARPAVVAAIVLPDAAAATDPIAVANTELARTILDPRRLTSPRELLRVDIGEAASGERTRHTMSG